MILGARWVQGAVLLATLFVLWSAFTRYQIAAEMADRRVVVEQEASALEARKTALETQVNYLSNERGIEAEMRRQFDIAKEGEKVVVIVDSEVEAPETIPPTASTTKKSWYEFWR
ncbi:MAG: septum formation initiator family protein [Bacteroidota bacterium]